MRCARKPPGCAMILSAVARHQRKYGGLRYRSGTSGVKKNAQREANAQAADAKARESASRLDDAKRSLRGLKGGFLRSGIESGPNSRGSSTPDQRPGEVEKQQVGPTFEAMKWPAQLPAVSAIRQYEALKAKALKDGATADGVPLPEGETKQRLRRALMERCQLQVPWLHRLKQ